MSIKTLLATKTTSTRLLTSLVKSHDPQVRIAAIKNDNLSVKMLRDRWLNDKDEEVRKEAERQLKKRNKFRPQRA